MIYKNTLTGQFLSRPNRFLAHVMVGGHEIVCHVKNTGRLGELLISGAPAVVQHHPDAAVSGRKTEYSLICIKKNGGFGDTWVNIDSQAPNQAAYEWLAHGNSLPVCPDSGSLRTEIRPDPDSLRREVRYGRARFDLAFFCENRPWFMEVKGVTLESNGTAMFPDAPTERGIKHLEELTAAAGEGYGAAVLFVIQMKGCSAFMPNETAHPEFANALRAAKESGVHIWAYDCDVTENAMEIGRPVTVLV